ncbi:hypothetical protein AAGS40_30140 (plasmid) [Paraburkholderia sp. PREW-6R]|uniref:hypothetical protein n=1 Tax=Paraburkholderia sp. PREW-6R TaxID=3141544 RepID=UPI0031F4A974
MKSPLFLSVALLFATVTTGCSTVRTQPLTHENAASIHSITVIQHRGMEEYRTLIVFNPAMAFGLIGGMVAAADMNAKSTRLTQALDPARTRLQERLATQLAEGLARDGYAVDTVALDSPKDAPAGAKPPADDLPKNLNGDAVLSTTMTSGYVSAGPGMPYVPSVRVNVIARRQASGAVIYQNTYAYGYTVGESDRAVHLDADAKYRFDNIDALVANADEAREALVTGVNAIAERIATDARRN